MFSFFIIRGNAISPPYIFRSLIRSCYCLHAGNRFESSFQAFEIFQHVAAYWQNDYMIFIITEVFCLHKMHLPENDGGINNQENGNPKLRNDQCFAKQIITTGERKSLL